MVLVQKRPFFQLFFQAIQARRMFFTIFQNVKIAFQAIKTTSSKSRKIDIFPKWLTHSFGPKKAIFPTFFFQGIQARKMFFTIFQNEKTPFQAIKTRSSKSRKIDIFPKGLTHSFGPKMAIFPTFIFQDIEAKKISVTIFQNEKTPFQAIKTTSSKSRKIDIFPKGLTHGVGPKMAIFPTFFLGNIGHQNVFCDILERKNVFLGYKNKKFKQSKNGHFFKGVNPLYFSSFVTEKQAFQTIKTLIIKIRKIWIFLKGLVYGFSQKM